MNFFDRLENLSRTIARIVALVGLAGLLCLAFATVLDVLLTWLFNYPIVGVRDASMLLIAVVIAASLPVCTAEQRHISVMFGEMLFNKKLQNILGIMAHLVTLVVFSLMAWQLWLHANEMSHQQEVTMVLGWPVSPWWRIVSFIVSSCVIIQAIVIMTSVRSFFFKKSS